MGSSDHSVVTPQWWQFIAGGRHRAIRCLLPHQDDCRIYALIDSVYKADGCIRLLATGIERARKKIVQIVNPLHRSIQVGPQAANGFALIFCFDHELADVATLKACARATPTCGTQGYAGRA